jgi:hypothetical protein
LSAGGDSHLKKEIGWRREREVGWSNDLEKAKGREKRGAFSI